MRAYFNPTIQPAPHLILEVNQSHPLAYGLIGAWVPTMLSRLPQAAGQMAPGIQDLSGVGTVLTSQDAGCEIAASAIGIVAKGSNDAGWIAPANAQQRISTTGSLFFSGIASAPASMTASAALILFLSYDASIATAPNLGLTFEMLNSDHTSIRCGWNSGGSARTLLTTGVVQVGNRLNCGFSLTTSGLAGSARFFANGVLANSGTAPAGTVAFGPAPNIFYAGGHAAAFTAKSGIDLGMGAMWKRALSDDEQAWLNAEPYAMFRVRRRNRWVFPAPNIGRSRLLQ